MTSAILGESEGDESVIPRMCSEVRKVTWVPNDEDSTKDDGDGVPKHNADVVAGGDSQVVDVRDDGTASKFGGCSSVCLIVFFLTSSPINCLGWSIHGMFVLSWSLASSNKGHALRMCLCVCKMGGVRVCFYGSFSTFTLQHFTLVPLHSPSSMPLQSNCPY